MISINQSRSRCQTLNLFSSLLMSAVLSVWNWCECHRSQCPIPQPKRRIISSPLFSAYSLICFSMPWSPPCSLWLIPPKLSTHSFSPQEISQHLHSISVPLHCQASCQALCCSPPPCSTYCKPLVKLWPLKHCFHFPSVTCPMMNQLP